MWTGDNVTHLFQLEEPLMPPELWHAFLWLPGLGLVKNPCPAQGATHQVTHFLMAIKA